MRPDPARLDIAVYPYQVQLTTQFADLDPGGHINNVAMSRHFETGRVLFDLHVHPSERLRLRRVVAYFSVAFVREAFFPEPLVCGVGVTRLGRSSYDFASAMFQKGQCVAVQEGTLVLTDDNGPTPMTEPFRRRFEPYRLRTISL